MEWMNQLVSNQVEPALQLDVLEAGRPFRSAEIQRLVAEFEHRQPDDAFPGRWAISLAGGDASRGGQIFLEKPELACLRCHQVKGNGGPVGPSLDGAL